MILAVFSDTHGSTAGMAAAVRRVRPDILVHLGDHIRDTAVLEREFPDLPLHAVPGNCDFAAREPDPDIFFAGPVKVFATHGHRYSVKLGHRQQCTGRLCHFRRPHFHNIVYKSCPERCGDTHDCL